MPPQAIPIEFDDNLVILYKNIPLSILPINWKAKMLKLYPVGLILTILYEGVVSGARIDTNYDVGLPKHLLQDVENCDIQIVNDAMSSNYFAFLSNSLLPTTVQFAMIYHETQNFSTIDNFILNMFKSRPAPNKISIWVSNLLLYAKENNGYARRQGHFTRWLELSTGYHYAFHCHKCDYNKIESYDWNFLRSTKHVYLVVPTRMKLFELLAILGIEDKVHDNFVVALLPQRKHGAYTRMCIKRTGLEIRYVEN